MKKRTLWGMSALLLMFGFVMAGCSTVNKISQENRGVFQNVAIPDKDFTSLGLVFVEKTYDIDENGAKGDIFTYYALLQEAKKLGGDYIINVTIDVRTDGTFNSILGAQLNFVKGKVTWYGAATVIKYTNALKTTSTVVTPIGNSSATTTNESYNMSGGSSSPAAGGKAKGFFARLFTRK